MLESSAAPGEMRLDQADALAGAGLAQDHVQRDEVVCVINNRARSGTTKQACSKPGPEAKGRSGNQDQCQAHVSIPQAVDVFIGSVVEPLTVRDIVDTRSEG